MPRVAKRPRSPTTEKLAQESSTKSKKLKLLAEHSLASPFPDYARPTATEAYQVHAVLSKAHPDIHATPKPASEGQNAARTCGSVPNVLESLIGTILSQNTSSNNSTAAKRSLDATFGRNNFEAIATAEKSAVVEAIRMGGLANKKAGVIQQILREVKERHGAYSLQHLANVVKSEPGVDEDKPTKHGGLDESVGEDKKVHSDVEAMEELVSYDGVGPKTASCVLLFCLGRESFPVDTHVFRLSKLLGWVPGKADRVTAQAHLDLKIPNELKYGLHVLMVGHGRRCKGCRGKGECPLKTWLKTKRDMDGSELERIESKL
ncbi:DNA glycosylase [Irpex lacteus]|nr:DNA glycosylase [Irpex lacteus]